MRSALVLLLIALTSCSEAKRASVASKESAVVELHEDGSCNWVNAKDVIEVPSGVEIMEELKLRSHCKSKLSDIRITTSCACTNASLSEKELEPGQEAILRFAFSSKSLLANTQKEVTIVVSSSTPDGTAHTHTLKHIFEASSGFDTISIRAKPSIVEVDENWDSYSSKEYRVQLELGKDLDSNSIEVSTESPFIDLQFVENSILVRLKSAPVGQIDGKIILRSKTQGVGIEIPVVGRIEPRYSVTPKLVNAGTFTGAGRPSSRLSIVDVSGKNEKPDIRVEGDWTIVSVSDSEKGWDVLVTLSGKASGYCAGNLFIGDAHGEVSIPLYASVLGK